MKSLLFTAFIFLTISLQAQPEIEKLNEIKNLGAKINTNNIEGEPKISSDGNTLYFTRRNDRRNVGGKNDDGDIWFSKLLEDSSWTEAKNLGKPVNNYSFNQVIAIHAGGKIMLISGEYQNDKHSDIYITALSQLGWSTPKIIPFENLSFKNDDATYSASSDLKILILSMKNYNNGIGKNDLYVSKRTAEGNWSEPINLGDSVNTPDEELYPIIAHDKKTLYFSSKGHKGYGDFDIFMTKRLDEDWNNWSTPKNLGKKINTIGYDADFTFDAKNQFAYISSDMESVEDFDIYRLEIPKQNKPSAVVILAIDIKNLNKSPNIIYSVVCKDLINDAIITKEDSVIDNFDLILSVGKDYKLEISAQNHLTFVDTIKLADKQNFQTISSNYTLLPTSKQFNFNQTTQIENSINYNSVNIENLDSLLNQVNFQVKKSSSRKKLIPVKALETKQSFTIIINSLTFETGKSSLSEEETKMLKELAMELNFNKNLMLEIIGHTDNTGSEATNLRLSNIRAKQVANHLINLGIDENRITHKGMGESQPVAPNDNIEYRKYNRRVEFRIYLKN